MEDFIDILINVSKQRCHDSIKRKFMLRNIVIKQEIGRTLNLIKL